MRAHKPQPRAQRIDLMDPDNLICQWMVSRGFSNKAIRQHKGFSPGQVYSRSKTVRVREGLDPLDRRLYRDGLSPEAIEEINNINKIQKMSPDQRQQFYKQLGFT